MTKKPGAAAPEAVGLSRIFMLRRPIVDQGVTVAEITLVEPELRHLTIAERKPSGGEEALSLISQLSGVSEAALRGLKLQDMRAIQRWIDGLRVESTATHVEQDEGAIFTLSVPLPTATGSIDKLRLREPDVECSIAVEKFKKPREQTAAMLAALADLTIPIVSRIKVRDLSLIEAWLTPFVMDIESTGGTGET